MTGVALHVSPPQQVRLYYNELHEVLHENILGDNNKWSTHPPHLVKQDTSFKGD